jgi:hypothetical protein
MHGCAGPELLSDSPYPARLTPARVWAMTDDDLDIKTYSLAEVAEMVLPPDMTNGIRWLSRRLNRGELSGVSRRSHLADDTRRRRGPDRAEPKPCSTAGRCMDGCPTGAPARRPWWLDADIARASGTWRLVIDGLMKQRRYSRWQCCRCTDRSDRRCWWGVDPTAVPGPKKGRSPAALHVELPGIEPATEIPVTCGDAEFDYAKVREQTQKNVMGAGAPALGE